MSRLPGGEHRQGQLDMCEAVAEALEDGHHLVVEAGTGVGKSLAYLVAAVLSGQRVVVATARRPLQDQLIRKDIPFVASALPGGVDAVVLKGRSNYLCLAKLTEAVGGDDGQGQLVVDRRRPALLNLAEWAAATESGDLADAPIPLDSGLRSLVTVTSRECPGASSCDHGERCLAERALERAREAQLVVTNMDLYCLDVGIGGGLLGPHDAVIFDEAHELEAIASRTFGLEIGARRFGWLSGQVRGLLTPGADEPAHLERAGEQLEAALTPAAGGRVDVTADAIAPAMAVADAAVSEVVDVIRKIPARERKDGRRDRCLQAASSLLEDVRRARTPGPHDVAWVPESGPATLLVAPVDVGPELARLVFTRRTAILTSATLSVGGSVAPLARRLGLGRADQSPPFTELRVGSPFDYWNHAVLYCPIHLPDLRRMPKSFDDAAVEELAGLVQAAGGRTLALFTSHRMLRRAAEALRDRFPWTVHVQDGPPEPGLIERFRDDETSCLLATMGYWQGVDVPGRSLNLVVIDRLPFASPKDPLLEARRDVARAAGEDSFDTVDLPLAATLLAQGAGRLIRTTTDRGVVAVLDRRLATSGYKHALLDSLPPMRRSIDGDEVRALLATLAAGEEPPPPPARRPPRPRTGSAVEARIGLAIGVGARSGAITELLPNGAVVELDGGEVVVVQWGQPVVHDGASRPLAAPDHTMSG